MAHGGGGGAHTSVPIGHHAIHDFYLYGADLLGTEREPYAFLLILSGSPSTTLVLLSPHDRQIGRLGLLILLHLHIGSSFFLAASSFGVHSFPSLV